MILILTTRGDHHTKVVVEALQKKGAAAFVYDADTFPVLATATVRFSHGIPEYTLRSGDKKTDLRAIETVWLRRLFPPTPIQTMSDAHQKFAASESQHLLRSLWASLEDKNWISTFDATRTASGKPYQLKMAGACGFEIPETLFTSVPAEALEFYDRCSGNVIYKPQTIISSASEAGTPPRQVFTNRVRHEDLVQRKEEIRLAPCLFQEYVPKHVELRVTVIGDEIFAVAIHSQDSDLTKDDWRKYGEHWHKVRHEVFSLSEDVERSIREFMQRTGLAFGAFDFIVTPDGRTVFLEVNPSGQWLWLEKATGLPLVDRFTDHLMRSRRNRQGGVAAAP